ncbi:tetraacyldisaccharide 4'-kinase [Chlamydia felis]|nr:tetraacyldisaccharide 4'-kinase [Chlamydia felis]
MKTRLPSPFFILYRRLTVAISFGKILGWGYLGRVLSWIFARTASFRRKLLFSAPYRSSSTVISVGNIVLGGAGKTPTVLWLAEALKARGYSCAVLSRGYKGKCSRQGKLTIVNPETHDAAYVGDEPLLMAKKLSKGSVFVHKDRRVAAKEASRNFDILILDDGFQNQKLHKDMEIVVVNGQDPLGGEAFFPRGRLRDFPQRLGEADAVIVNGSCSVENQKRLNTWCTSPKIFVEPRISQILWAPSGEQLSLDSLSGLAAGVFCGLGFPQGFLDMLKRAGVKILGTYLLPDHAGITKKELHYFCSKIAMRQGQGILCTEKDSMNLGNLIHEPGMLPIGMVQMHFDFIDLEGSTASLLDRIDQIHNGKR